MIAFLQEEAQVHTATSFELRCATPEDRDELVAMYLSFEPKGASLGLPPRKEPQHWLAKLAAYPSFVILAEGRVVGHAVLCPQKDAGEVAVFVHQDFRGLGLGKRLLSGLIAEARRMDLQCVWGITELANFPMLRLAYSLGFTRGKEPGEFYLNLRDRSIPKDVEVAPLGHPSL